MCNTTTTNGSQHLAALTKDQITAPYVNLVPSEMPGDLYAYVADHVWETIDKNLRQMNKVDIFLCEKYIDNLLDFKKQISAAEPKSDRRKVLVSDIQRFKSANEDIAKKSCIVFWARVKDKKQRRKIVKRRWRF